MSNLTVLEQNTLSGFEYEDTQELYLRGAQRDEIKAFLMADQWEKYLRNLKGIILFDTSLQKGNPHITKTPQETADEVMDFIKERHYRSYFPDGRKS